VAFGLASIMLCIGLVIRVKVPFIRNMLVPTSIIAGILGFIIINTGLITSTDSEMYIEMVNYLFTIMFISLTLTSSNDSSKSKKSTGKNITQGSIGIGVVWSLLYSLTPLIGALILMVVGGAFGMNPIYGLLIPFAFTQGTGQAATFGSVMEQEHGLLDAATVGVTFAAIGFIVCFVIGVPLAKFGIKKGLAKRLGTDKIEEHIQRGYYKQEDNRDTMGNETMFNGNIDTMTFHFAIVGVGLVLAMLMSKAVSYIPAIGPTFAGLLFLYGMIVVYILKYLLKKLKIDYMLDNKFQSRITGWATDYLIVASFMGVQLAVISKWMAPIIIVSIIVTIVTLLVSIYFGQRMGGNNDFERTLGLFGAATGQVHSGLALIRIVDPAFNSTTAIELGLMNLVNSFFVNWIAVVILAISSGFFTWNTGVSIMLATIPFYLILLKVFKVWGKKTYSLKPKEKPEEKVKSIDTSIM